MSEEKCHRDVLCRCGANNIDHDCGLCYVCRVYCKDKLPVREVEPVYSPIIEERPDNLAVAVAYEELESENTQLRKDIDSLNDFIARLEQKTLDTDAFLDSHHEMTRKYDALIKSQQEQIKEKNAEIESMYTKCNELEDSTRELKATVEQQSERINKLDIMLTVRAEDQPPEKQVIEKPVEKKETVAAAITRGKTVSAKRQPVKIARGPLSK